jgi:two-component system, NtrC family, sensor kinase
MTKPFLLTILLALSSSISIAQSDYTDSLKAALAKATDPVERFNLIVKTLENDDAYRGSQIDSSASAELFKIAQGQKSDAMLATSYNWIGYYLAYVKGDNAAGLDYFFKALPLAEKVNDKRRISSLYFDIAGIYNFLQNWQEELKYTLIGGKNLPDQSSPMYDYMLVQYQRNRANYFLRVDQLDSATYYGRAFSSTSERVNGINYSFQAAMFNARLNWKVGKNDLAEMYFNKANALSDSIKIVARKVNFYSANVRFLLSNNRIQEAKIKTQKAWLIAQQNNNPNLKLIAANLKRLFFDKLNQTDSAYYYLKAETEARDLIFNQNNQNIIQALAFKEQMRGIEEEGKKAAYQTQLRQYALLGGLGVFSIVALVLYRNNLNRKKANELLQNKNAEIEKQKENVEHALADLKSTQKQLIQSEKMASLGELTAGIAHEIQNPLNFVNNFSEVNTELIKEIQDERRKTQDQRDQKLEDQLLQDIVQNQEKINHHGKRASDIVKGMLQHSRSSSGVKEPTNINALADEYLRLAYHGLRAKDKDFNASLKTDFDESIGNINIIPQDIGRVILNLITNAFYAVNEKATLRQAQGDSNYEPTVSVSTHRSLSTGEGRGEVLIKVKDNGNGIPQKILDKIFQPFFTTKPTGQGTGLGLSLSYDIVRAHGGELKVETREGEGSEFIIVLPINS